MNKAVEDKSEELRTKWQLETFQIVSEYNPDTDDIDGFDPWELNVCSYHLVPLCCSDRDRHRTDPMVVLKVRNEQKRCDAVPCNCKKDSIEPQFPETRSLHLSTTRGRQQLGPSVVMIDRSICTKCEAHRERTRAATREKQRDSKHKRAHDGDDDAPSSPEKRSKTVPPKRPKA